MSGTTAAPDVPMPAAVHKLAKEAVAQVEGTLTALCAASQSEQMEVLPYTVRSIVARLNVLNNALLGALSPELDGGPEDCAEAMRVALFGEFKGMADG